MRLVDALVADGLGAEQAIGLALEHHLQRHDLAAGVVAGMAHRGEHHGVVRDAGALASGLGKPGGSGREIEHLDDRGALGAGEAAVQPANDVGCHAPLAWLAGPGKRDERVVAGDEVAYLHGVAHGVDVLDAGFHAIVHDDAALDAGFKSGCLGEGRIGRDADGEHHHVGAQRLFAGHKNVDAPRRALRIPPRNGPVPDARRERASPGG